MAGDKASDPHPHLASDRPRPGAAADDRPLAETVPAVLNRPMSKVSGGKTEAG